MPSKKIAPYPGPQAIPPFELKKFLESAGIKRKITKYARSAVIFTQGDSATDVFYVQLGRIKLSVLSRPGKKAVVAILGPGDFFGEGCLAGQPRRMSTASALSASTVLVIEKGQMQEMIHNEPALAARFLTHMLASTTRMAEALIAHLFTTRERRPARALLLLARYGKDNQPQT